MLKSHNLRELYRGGTTLQSSMTPLPRGTHASSSQVRTAKHKSGRDEQQLGIILHKKMYLRGKEDSGVQKDLDPLCLRDPMQLLDTQRQNNLNKRMPLWVPAARGTVGRLLSAKLSALKKEQ